MVNINKLGIIFFVFLIIIGIFGCSATIPGNYRDNPKEKETKTDVGIEIRNDNGIEYEAGVIIVAFKQEVDGKEALDILTSYNLSLARETLPTRYTYFIDVVDNNTKNYKNINDPCTDLSLSGLFYMADSVVLPEYAPQELANSLVAYVHLNTTQEKVNTFINSCKKFKINKIETNAINLLAKVPVGEEIKSTSELEKDNKIEFAEINVIEHLTTNSMK